MRSLAIGLVLGCAVRAAAQTTAADLIAAAQVQVRDHNLDSAAVLLHQVVRPDAPGTLQERIEGWLLLGMVQSYIYSVGNIGTVTVWVCAFLGGAVVSRRAAA